MSGAMSALRDPVIRCIPVVSGSPPRVKKSLGRPPSQPNVATTEPRPPPSTNQIHPLFLKTTKVKGEPVHITTSLSNGRPNALKLSNVSPIVSNIFAASSTVTVLPAQQRWQFATASKSQPEPTTVKKSSNISKNTQQAASDAKIQPPKETLEAKPSLPIYSFSEYSPIPTLKYIRSESEANRLLENVSGPLGFDLEWKVLMRKNIPQRPVAVVQVASAKAIHIIQVSAMKGVFPKKLKEILEDSTIIKAGVNVRSDAKKLYTDYKVKVQNLVELSWLSRVADPDLKCGGKATHRTTISLQRLVAAYLKKELVKSEVRTGNWEAMLDKKQLQYAANDAHCSVVLYEYLVQLAKRHKQTLVPSVFTLNVNTQGEVVADTETPAYEEVKNDEVESQEPSGTEAPSLESRPAFAVSKPSSKDKAPISTSESESANRKVVFKYKPSIPRVTTVSKAPTTKNQKIVASQPPEIIEIDSNTETDDELQKLAENFMNFRMVETTAKRQPVASGTHISTFRSISEARYSAQATSTSKKLNVPPENTEDHAPLGSTPFTEGTISISRTMAYAMGIQK